MAKPNFFFPHLVVQFRPHAIEVVSTAVALAHLDVIVDTVAPFRVLYAEEIEKFFHQFL